MFESCRDRQLNLNRLHAYHQTGLRCVWHAQWRLPYFASPRLCTLGPKRRSGRWLNQEKVQASRKAGMEHTPKLLLAFWTSIGFKPVTS
jgi:hypothetical protein